MFQRFFGPLAMGIAMIHLNRPALPRRAKITILTGKKCFHRRDSIYKGVSMDAADRTFCDIFIAVRLKGRPQLLALCTS